MARTANATNGNRKILENVDEQIARIRSDIADLAKTAGSAGVVIGDDVKQVAEEKKDQSLAVAQEAIKGLRRELDKVERQITGKVRENPLAAIAIAAGVGFLIALLSRRN